MAKYIFSNLVGSFAFDEKFKVVDKILFKNLSEYKNKDKSEKRLINKYKDAKKADENQLKKILLFFKNNQYFNEFYKKNLLLTKEKIKESVKDDVLIIQTISNIEDIDKVINMLVKRLRDWYAFYNPEFSESIEGHEDFVKLILKKNKKELLREIKVKEEESMGGDFSKENLEPIMNLAKEVNELYNFRNKQGEYLEKLMKKICPSMAEVAGVLIGAKLIEVAGSLKHLAMLPASVIQLLGAEKALFRHIKNKKNLPPKFGVLFEHKFIQKNFKNSGKAARTLADKICIAVKVDYFKGKFIGDKLNKELDEKFK
ncbi:hypothetical protein ISS05_01395 [Candidatus Woesearchaeota archaeon]|nr:hypothetical protein [Candidatus Woesearchaeota archaeon]